MFSTASSEYSAGLFIRQITPPLRLADFKVMVFDMDSTLINIECIDELADFAGQKNAVAAITEATMRGEITDFQDSLRQRVALLKGMPETALQAVLEQRLKFNPGAEKLIQRVKQAGLKTLLVSGGFTFFAEHVKNHLGLDCAYANELEIVDHQLTGRLLGDIVDGAAKRHHLLSFCADQGCLSQEAIAVGDGANDLLMMQVAGLSVAYHAKPKVQEHAMVSITQGGLDRLLEVCL